jgi:hypothetical protein|tara:strand:+ start:4428 stop:4676 length:249 start_codon:yes stop_codon:yes gene_type:complete
MKKKDLTEGKSWFQIVAISNSYLWMFIAVLAVVIWGALDPVEFGYPDCGYWILELLGLTMLGVIGYKGLYQKYNDLKNGRIR